MTTTPECDKMLAVHDKSQAIGEFIDWLGAVGIHLAEYITHYECQWSINEGYRYQRRCDRGRCIEGLAGQTELEDVGACPNCKGEGLIAYRDPPLRVRSGSIEQLLADYFDIDLVKVEVERRAMLAELRGGA